MLKCYDHTRLAYQQTWCEKRVNIVYQKTVWPLKTSMREVKPQTLMLIFEVYINGVFGNVTIFIMKCFTWLEFKKRVHVERLTDSFTFHWRNYCLASSFQRYISLFNLQQSVFLCQFLYLYSRLLNCIWFGRKMRERGLLPVIS